MERCAQRSLTHPPLFFSYHRQAKEGVKIGVLQAHDDAKITTISRKHQSCVTYVTRKPLGPRSFASLIRMAKMPLEESKARSRDVNSQDRLPESGGEALGRLSLGELSVF